MSSVTKCVGGSELERSQMKGVDRKRAPRLGFGLSVVPLPSLSIVIMAVGTRGDVQPFISLGLKLQSQGHKGIASKKILASITLNDWIFVRNN